MLKEFEKAIKYLKDVPANKIQPKDMVVIPYFTAAVMIDYKLAGVIQHPAMFASLLPNQPLATVIWNWQRAIRNIHLMLQLNEQGFECAFCDESDLVVQGVNINLYLSQRQADRDPNEDVYKLIFDDWRYNVQEINGLHLYKDVSVTLLEAVVKMKSL